MNLLEVRTCIQNRKSKGETYQSIADDLGINRALARYIGLHPNYKPSLRIKKTLKLDPDNRLIRTRKRRAILDGIARRLGFRSWCAYETLVVHREINEHKS